MRGSLLVFSILAATAWAILLYVSIHAATVMGVGAAGPVYFADFAHPWRAQFGADFSIHLLLVAGWMIWRSRSWPGGILCAVLAINLGALFTLPFLVIAAWKSGNVSAALVGARRASALTAG